SWPRAGEWRARSLSHDLVSVAVWRDWRGKLPSNIPTNALRDVFVCGTTRSCARLQAHPAFDLQSLTVRMTSHGRAGCSILRERFRGRTALGAGDQGRATPDSHRASPARR